MRDLAQAVVLEGEHPLHHGGLLEVLGGAALDDQALDLLGHEHHLVEREPALVAGAAARRAADARGAASATRRRRGPPSASPTSMQLGLGRLVRVLALVAQPAGEPLGDHAVERARDEERLDAHLDEPQRGRRGVVGVQRRQHHVTGERGLDRDDRGLAVADLTDEHDVGVGTQDRPQRRREREPGLRVDLHLVDAGQPVLDRVLDRDDVAVGLVERVERRVERGRLSRTGRAGHEDRAVRLAVRRSRSAPRSRAGSRAPRGAGPPGPCRGFA